MLLRKSAGAQAFVVRTHNEGGSFDVVDMEGLPHRGREIVFVLSKGPPMWMGICELVEEVLHLSQALGKKARKCSNDPFGGNGPTTTRGRKGRNVESASQAKMWGKELRECPETLQM